MDRSALSQALAKVIAYQQCGKLDEARRWQAILNELINKGLRK